MKQLFSTRTGQWSLLALFLLACAASFSGAQDAAETAKPEAKRRGRLPAYFAAVVNEKQREQIYDLQAKYAEQMEALQKQLDALASQRDTEIDGVLTPEQLAEVNKKREEAKAARAKRAKPAEEPAEAAGDAN